jgi:hypothetical protein
LPEASQAGSSSLAIAARIWRRPAFGCHIGGNQDAAVGIASAVRDVSVHCWTPIDATISGDDALSLQADGFLDRNLCRTNALILTLAEFHHVWSDLTRTLIDVVNRRPA